MKKFLAVAAILAAFSSSAMAQTAATITPTSTVTTKAITPSPFFSSAYPYGTSGMIFGLFTEAAASNVSGNAAGVSPSSLTSVSAGVGVTAGYSWGSKSSQVAYSIEGDAGWTNFNGSAPGLAFTGPAEFEVRGVMMTPLNNLANLLPSWQSIFGTVAPFNPLPTGVTASNLQIGLMAGVHVNDISADFPGLGSSQEWQAQAMVGVLMMEQLSNGTALRSYAKELLGNEEVCAGPVPARQACINHGATTLIGASVLW
jgi:hypothetical protein